MSKTRLAIATLSSILLLATVAPSQAGGYRGHGYGPSGYSQGYAYRKKRANTGAIVAGTLGALVLGSIAGQGFAGQAPGYPVQPDYGPYGSGYAPVAGGYGYPQCTVVQRRVVDPYGMVQVVREKVCN